MEGLERARRCLDLSTGDESGMTMLRLKPDGGGEGPLQILCLGCHSDDIEIGCGGAVLKLGAERQDAEFHWVVFSTKGVRGSEAACAANQFVDPSRIKRMIL